MKLYCVLIFFLGILFYVCTAFPVDNRDSPQEVKSVFGPPFDEIVVESSLTVRRKNDSRQGRNKNVDKSEPATITSNARVKRQFIGNFAGGRRGTKPPFPNVPSGGASAADAQAQGFNVNGPLGGFGASATGAQTQSIGFGPGGPSGAFGFSGSQKYHLPNGQVIDVVFGNTFSSTNGNSATGGSSAVTITDSNGMTQNL